MPGAVLKGYPASTTFRVEYGETDSQGRVFYANYLPFFDRGRVAYWVQAGLSEEEIRRIEHDTVIAEVHCTYRAPAGFYDIVSVHTRIARIGRSSLRMEFVVRNDATDTLMAEGYATLVKVDLATNRSVPFADEFKAKLRGLEGRALED
ncbi:MAG TPA: thioesterase family protein [Candidatus Tectomicrobia bacterium]|nr:thioesterase family protein [Candidatus Tectomicrobia bacterium]